MKRNLLEWIAERGILAADGATGTALQQAGLAAGGCPEVWNVDHPDAVRLVAATYVEVGAEIVETNSFGGSPQKLACYGLSDRCRELNRAAASLAREAAGDRALVGGSIGPTGQLLEPLGPLAEKAALEGFRRQAEALAEGGADFLCVETMTDVTEAALAVRAAVGTGLPVAVTMTFDKTPRGYYTIMGVDIKRAVAELTAAGADVLGSNCGTGPETMVEILQVMRTHSPRPLLVQANAGLPQVSGTEVVYPETPESMASFVPALVEAGAAIIGGCCGNGPEHIRAIVQAIVTLRG